MPRNYSDHARITAICVNLALDEVEADLRDALEKASDETAEVLRYVLDLTKRRRVFPDAILPLGPPA